MMKRDMDERTMTIELTDRELKLIRANIAYAIENCPVDGGIMTEDGHFSSKEYYDELHKKLKALTVTTTNKIDVDSEELKFIITTAEYALENCPVEGKIMMEDAQFSSKEMFQELLKKLKSFESNPMAAPQSRRQGRTKQTLSHYRCISCLPLKSWMMSTNSYCEW